MTLLVIAAFALGHSLGVRGLRSPPPLSGDSLVVAVREVLAEPNELRRGEGLAPLLQSVQAADLESVAGVYEETFPGLGPGKVAMQLLCERWARLDPEGASRHIATWTRYWKRMALTFLIRSWARTDISAAREALEDAEISPEGRKDATNALLKGWVESGAPDVWDAYLAGLPFGFEAALEIMTHLARRDGLAAMERRVEALPDAPDSFKRRALQVLLLLAVQNDIERAQSIVERHADTAAGRGLRLTLGTQWVGRDGPAAMAWLFAQPTELKLDYAIRSAYQRWIVVNPDIALDWAETEADPRVALFRDLHAIALAERDPKRAAELAESVESEPARSTALRRIAQSWHPRDPDAAETWFGARGLEQLLRPQGPARSLGRRGGTRPGPQPEDE